MISCSLCISGQVALRQVKGSEPVRARSRAFTSVEYSRSLAALSCGHRRRATRGADPCAVALRAARDLWRAENAGRPAAVRPLWGADATDRLSHRPRMDQPHPRLLRLASQTPQSPRSLAVLPGRASVGRVSAPFIGGMISPRLATCAEWRLFLHRRHLSASNVSHGCRCALGR